MNSPGSIILLSSKYSSACKSFDDFIKRYPAFLADSNLQNVNIDNESIRKRILSSTSVKIEEVPCILVIYPDGGVEKYEKDYAFRWAEDIISKLYPVQEPIPIQSPVQPVQAYREQEPEPVYRKPAPRPKPVPRPKQRPQIRKPKQRPAEQSPEQQSQEVEDIPVQATPIEDLDDAPGIDDVEDEPDRNSNRPGPKRVRDNRGGYQEDDDLFSGEPVDNHRGNSKPVKQSTEPIKNHPESIAAKVARLQKQRDADEQVLKKAGGGGGRQ
jgi:hypothetical protein